MQSWFSLVFLEGSSFSGGNREGPSLFCGNLFFYSPFLSGVLWSLVLVSGRLKSCYYLGSEKLCTGTLSQHWKYKCFEVEFGEKKTLKGSLKTWKQFHVTVYASWMTLSLVCPSSWTWIFLSPDSLIAPPPPHQPLSLVWARLFLTLFSSYFLIIHISLSPSLCGVCLLSTLNDWFRVYLCLSFALHFWCFYLSLKTNFSYLF